jgi:hypothetical protein
MVRFRRLLGWVSIVWCLLCLLLACAPEPTSVEDVPTSADSGGVNSDRATATPTSVMLTPPGSLRPVTTPGVKLLTPLPTLVQEEGEMMPTASVSPGLQRFVEQALADLAARLAIETDQIEVIEAKAVVWPDASLGCPQPGMMYAQVQTVGFLIRLEARGQVYEYHTDMQQIIILCNPALEVSNPSKNTDKNVDDGWPNETKDNDVIITTPTK